MEIKEVERIAIAKPVASKPSFSKFRSFSELLAGAINASPSPANVCPETAMAAAIRPKTIRVKPALIAPPSSQGEASGTKKPAQIKSSVVYKPLAKVVSKATVSLLATLGGPSITHQQVLAQVEARAQHLSQSKPMSIVPAQGEKAKETSEAVEDEPKPLAASANVDRASYDGYNWRKYGQKQVKGSEYPRSYYKCTHPNCPVKKKVERLLDGQIAEIVYKGEHSHPKPLPPKKSSSQDARSPKSSNNVSESNEASEEGHVQNQGVLPTQSTYLRKPRKLSHNQGAAGAYHNGVGAPDDSCVPCEETSKGLEVEHDDEPRSKRRKSRNQNNEAGKSGEVVIPVQNATETAVLGDGFRWRKYGQKVVKGNPNPRSYYKCTSLKCDVRKHVERTTEDPKAFVTTYEGKHNHDMPFSK